MSTKSIFDISRWRNDLSKICQPNPFLIYLAHEIIWARFINQIHFWYILLEKLLEQDIPTKSIFDKSCSKNNLSKIYQPNQFSIYLAREITWVRYINLTHLWFILLENLLEREISTKSIFDISCLINYFSKIYQLNQFLINLAR